MHPTQHCAALRCTEAQTFSDSDLVLIVDCSQKHKNAYPRGEVVPPTPPSPPVWKTAAEAMEGMGESSQVHLHAPPHDHSAIKPRYRSEDANANAADAYAYPPVLIPVAPVPQVFFLGAVTTAKVALSTMSDPPTVIECGVLACALLDTPQIMYYLDPNPSEAQRTMTVKTMTAFAIWIGMSEGTSADRTVVKDIHNVIAWLDLAQYVKCSAYGARQSKLLRLDCAVCVNDQPMPELLRKVQLLALAWYKSLAEMDF